MEGLAELKCRLTEIEAKLADSTFVVLHTCQTPAGPLRVAVTDRLRRAARKARVWKSTSMLTALKNARYGFRSDRPRSRGGLDGVFRIDRSFRPKNAMMRILFDGLLDKPNSEAPSIAGALSTRVEDLVPVRLVSHHMRLLGVMAPGDPEPTLVLLDLDIHKG